MGVLESALESEMMIYNKSEIASKSRSVFGFVGMVPVTQHFHAFSAIPHDTKVHLGHIVISRHDSLHSPLTHLNTICHHHSL